VPKKVAREAGGIVWPTATAFEPWEREWRESLPAPLGAASEYVVAHTYTSTEGRISPRWGSPEVNGSFLSHGSKGVAVGQMTSPLAGLGCGEDSGDSQRHADQQRELQVLPQGRGLPRPRAPQGVPLHQSHVPDRNRHRTLRGGDSERQLTSNVNSQALP